MSAIAWELPEDVRAVRDGLLDFARKEILPRHRGASRPVRGSAAALSRGRAVFRCAEGADRRGAARLGQGRLLQHVRARIAGRRRPGASCLLCRLGGAVPALRAAELADALCHQPLGLRAEPASRKGHGRGARAHAGADDGGRGVDVLRPVASRAPAPMRRRWRRAPGPTATAGASRAARSGPPTRRSPTTASSSRSPIPSGRPQRKRRHQRLPRAHQLAGLRGPARDQAVRPYRRRRGRAAPGGRARRAVAGRGRAAPGFCRRALRRVARPHLQFGARRRLRPLGARARAGVRQDAQGLRPADRRLPGRDLPAGRERHRAAWRASHGPQRRPAARPGRAGHQGAVDGQGLFGAGRLPRRRPRHADPRRHGLHQRGRPAPRLALACASSTSPTAPTRS